MPIAYLTYDDLARDTMALAAKVSPYLPQVAGVLGVARSGMIPATMLAELWQLPVGEVGTFASTGQFLASGPRLHRRWRRKAAEGGTILVVDDSTHCGTAMRGTVEQLQPRSAQWRFLYSAVYRNPEHPEAVGLFGRDVPAPRYFQWNLMQHAHCTSWMWDIDGVLCLDPRARDDDGRRYQLALKRAVPLHIPRRWKVHTLITMRLERWRNITTRWLRWYGARYGNLVMAPFATAAERRAKCNYGQFKGEHYKASPCTLFIESDSDQAAVIARVSGKPVICLGNHQVYQ